jgi:SAM-dependent methyltransferase
MVAHDLRADVRQLAGPIDVAKVFSMSFELRCPLDDAVLHAQADGWVCPDCDHCYAERRGVVCFLDSTDEFYEGRYLNTIRFVPKSERLRHAWPVWFINSGYPWAVRKYVPEGARIMEMGCASGVAYFAERYRVLGLDLSASSLALVSELYDTCVQADVTHRIPLPDGCLDAIVSSYVWEHIRPMDKPAALSEFWRVLKPGGKIVFLFDVEGRNPIYRVLKRRDMARYREALIDREGHYGWETPQENQKAFEAAGFRMLEFRGKDKLLIPPPMFGKIREWGGALDRIGAIGSWFSKGWRFRLANAVLRILDETVGRMLPVSWSRVVVVVYEKP